MASKEQIKRTILEVAGNPESGVVKEYADKWAEAIVAIDGDVAPEKKASTDKENRVTKPSETR